ncbi:DUF6284 family protein [Streptomyces sp. P9-2B-2]|uniref:DUF6284 family protein n=1 Tax=Streptomyces sp. P9-2B-2 TaxID=3057114 RepID=UPI0025B60885|nr:DUF6284 family protein [Streptomyces sp. P9-2B-2]WJY40017.1 DUF6284 family protein [Streptomyces sp. P9-2B-2]
MRNIAAVQAVVTATEFDRGPTAAELDAIDAEMLSILEDVVRLDEQIALLNPPLSELKERRHRRARRRVLAERRVLANRNAAQTGDAA